MFLQQWTYNYSVISLPLHVSKEIFSGCDFLFFGFVLFPFLCLSCIKKLVIMFTWHISTSEAWIFENTFCSERTLLAYQYSSDRCLLITFYEIVHKISHLESNGIWYPETHCSVLKKLQLKIHTVLRQY